MKKQQQKQTDKLKSKVTALVLLAALYTTSAYAQDGNAGINQATSQVKSYFAAGTNLMYAIGAIVGLVGAVNDTYKPKGADEAVQLTTFFNCSYWFNTNVVKVLRKGAVVRLDGRLSARGYTTNTGDNGASLDFHTNYINVLAYAQKKEGQTNADTTASEKAPEEKDDLPF